MKQPLRLMPLLVGTLVAVGMLFSQLHPNIGGKAFNSPEVVTDKADYEPGSTAHVIGSGFLPKETVSLQVLHADGAPSTGADDEPWLVRADAHGEFATTWHVCDCVGALLELTAVGERSGLTAQTRFTDGPSAGEKLEGWFNLANQWGGTIQGVNSKYTEGDTIPLRFSASLTGGTTHTVLLKYDFGASGLGPHFFDSLGSFDATIHNADPAAGISGAETPTTWAVPTIPIDSTLPDTARFSGRLTTYNVSTSGPGISFGSYTLVNGVKMIPVTFTVAGSGGKKNVILAYGGHLARASDWGPNNGASTFPGASRKAFANLDGNADVNVSVNPNAIVAQADLAITKVADKSSVRAGENLTYTITVANSGPGAATSVVVTDELPAGTTFVSETHSQGTFTPASPLTFALGTINAGAFATIQITVRVDATVGSISNTATATAATADPATANNTATQSVTINDTTPPTITCPDNKTFSTDAGQCSALVTFTVSATDNLPGPVSVVCNPASGSSFFVGTTPVTCTATDAAGNTSACGFTVTINDTEPPEIACPAPPPVARPNDPGQCSAAVTFAVSVTDNCPDATLVCSPASGSAFPVGETLVTCTAQDASDNTSGCSFTVTVNDTESPHIVRPEGIVRGECDALVNYPTPEATDNCPGVITVVCSPPSGSVFPAGTSTVICAATDAAGNVGTTSFSVTINDPFNKSWPAALDLHLAENQDGVFEAATSQCITTAGQSRWFKFKVQPGSKAIVRLTNLPANYDVVLYKDIAAAFRELNSPQDLVQLNAEFAAEAFSAEAFSAEAFSAEAFSAEAFSAEAFSAEAFSAEAFSAEAFSAEAFSAEAFSAEAFSAEAFSAEAFSAEAFSAEAFSDIAFSAEAFSAEAFSAEAFSGAFSSAQTRSVLAVSTFNGVANELVIKNTWDNDGYFYVRVRGRNGAFSLSTPFQLQVFLIPGACGDVTSVPVDTDGHPLPASTVAIPGQNYKTIILTDLDRMLDPGPSQARTDLLNKLTTFAGRTEVKGAVVDVGTDAWVSFFNAQADDHFDCPFAKNLVAGAIKAIVDRSRAGNALEYVVIVGNDDVIPFFRYRDLALLASENMFVPPVRDNTASQASLRLGYVLGQDAYGTECQLSLKAGEFPLPDLAVGRLVETADQVGGMLDAYMATADGVVPTPTSALVTGYDFLEDCARAVQGELEAGIGAAADALIADRDLAPERGWTADDLRVKLLGSRHDLIFLAGHFSAVSTLAADYSTRLLASELLDSPVNLTNALLFSLGCHAGYNIVDADDIPGVTREPDWTQVFAGKRMPAVINTGYGYGDTDTIQFGEQLFLEFSRQLRAGTGPIAIGKALVQAKQIYLAGTPQLRGIHEKTILQASLYGLPMMQLNLPNGRGALSGDQSIVTQVSGFETNPGLTLGLKSAEITVPTPLTTHTTTLTDPSNDSTVTATYLTGANGIVSNPGEPVLPLVVSNVTVADTVLRGVGFLGGTYSDELNPVWPLTCAPVTEIRGVHAPFLSDVFYPIQPWAVNYFDALCTASGGATRLLLTPAQFRSSSPGSPTGTLRQFTSMQFRLYYSSNTATYTPPMGTPNPLVPGLAAAPDIASVSDVVENEVVNFRIRVLGDPAAGIQEVWVTYTATTGDWFGQWQPLDLSQDPDDSTLWTGTLPPLPQGTTVDNVRYQVWAVNGVGLVSSKTKLGAYYTPGESSGPLPTIPTTITLQSPPPNGKYGTDVTLKAALSGTSGPLAGQEIVFIVGSQKKRTNTVTDIDGHATAEVTMRLLGLPGEYELQASFEGSGDFKPSSASIPFTIKKQDTVLKLTPQLALAQNNTTTLVMATLTDKVGRPLSEHTVFFVVSGANGTFATADITDFAGRLPLGAVPLPDGTYTVNAYFSGTIPLPPPAEPTTLEDVRYVHSSASSLLVIDSQAPVISCPANIVAPAPPPGQCSAIVSFTATATDRGLPVPVVCDPPSGSAFKIGTSTVNCQATDGANNIATCAFTVTVGSNKCPLSQGYWKTHTDLWPVTSLTLGSLTYTKTQLISVMNNTSTSDASLILARQLIAAMLNLANGSSCCPVCSTIDDANRLLVDCALPCKVNVRSVKGAAMVNDAAILEQYNTGGLTPGCTP